MKDKIYKYRYYLIGLGIGIVLVIAAILISGLFRENYIIKTQQKELSEKKTEAIKQGATTIPTQAPLTQKVIADKEQEEIEVTPEVLVTVTPTPIPDPVMLPEYAVLYEENPDIIGWLSIKDTNIDYPVMQTPEDEQYYLYRDFYGEENRNGSLIMDTDSTVGIGCREQAYIGGTSPSTNLIIHGHTMKSGLMFGKLSLYEDEAYGKEHNIICFDSLYEKREYELISVFRSQVYKKSDKVFKYYQFFEADAQDEFQTWYRNIKEMALYDTGVTAQFGDEFITLTCCTYHVEDGRFVVVGKRVK
jgi:sortase B